MSLNKIWYTAEQAVAKYGISPSQLDKWVERGLVRTEKNNGEELVNCNDIEQELHLIPSL
jgi:DNA-binding transcriptional MerR regulator